MGKVRPFTNFAPLFRKVRAKTRSPGNDDALGDVTKGMRSSLIQLPG